MRKLASLIILLLFTTVYNSLQAQSPIKTLPSPLAMVTYKYGDTYIKITYCRPAKKNRQVFGELVPFGKVWRTGANEATEITLTQDIKMGGQTVKAGTYTFLTIPDKEQWTVVLNNELGQWGAFKYNESRDYLRFNVSSSKMESTYEVFTMEFETIDPKAGQVNLLLKWENTKVTIPLELTTGTNPK